MHLSFRFILFLYGNTAPITAWRACLGFVTTERYEKGFSLLWHLQTQAGGAAQFDPFVKAYVKNFAFKTLTSENFKNFYLDYFKDNKHANLDAIQWDDWFTK